MSTPMNEPVAANVTEAQLRKYLEVFFGHLEEMADQHLPDQSHQLFHTSHLPATITGYVSTQYGVGYEMRRASVTSIEVRRGSSRVEDLVWRGAPKRTPPAIVIRDSHRILIQRATFSDLIPVRLAGDSDDISLVDVTCEFRSGYRRALDFLWLSSRRNSELWTPERAVSRAAAEVLRAMAEIQLARRAKISIAEFVANHKQRTVLLLGSYDPEGLVRLQRIADSLTRVGYQPFLVSDIADHPAQSLLQKVTMLGHLARFVVFDDTEPSGHLVELSAALANGWPILAMQGHGRPTTAMLVEAPTFHPMYHAIAYDPASPSAAIQEAMPWIEGKLRAVTHEFNGAYPWRVGLGGHGDEVVP